MKIILQTARLATFAAIVAATSSSFAQSAPSAPAPAGGATQVLAPTLVTAAEAEPAFYGERGAPVPRGMRRRHIETAYSGGPVPDGSRVETRANRVFVGLGVGALAGGWLGSLVGFFATVSCYSGFLSVSCHSAPAEMLIPLIGPWAALADSRNDSAGNALLVIDGLVQTGGLALMIAGGMMRHPVLVRDELRFQAHRADRGSWAFAPAVSATSAGVGVTGTF